MCLSFLGFGAALGARDPRAAVFVISAHLFVTEAIRADRSALLLPTAAFPNSLVPNCCKLMPYCVSSTCARFKLCRMLHGCKRLIYCNHVAGIRHAFEDLIDPHVVVGGILSGEISFEHI